MMKTTSVDLVFEGAKFSPKALKAATGLRIVPLVEFGEIAKRGRYRGQEAPYGLATLKIESASPEDLNIIINSALKYLQLERDSLLKAGVEDVSLDTESIEGKDLAVSDEVYKNLEQLNKALIKHVEPHNQADYDAVNVQIGKSDAEILHLYSFFFLKDLNNKLLSSHKEIKLKHLFSKVLHSNIPYSQIDREELIHTVVMYLFSYIDEEFDKVPSFEKVLKENHPGGL